MRRFGTRNPNSNYNNFDRPEGKSNYNQGERKETFNKDSKFQSRGNRDRDGYNQKKPFGGERDRANGQDRRDFRNKENDRGFGSKNQKFDRDFGDRGQRSKYDREGQGMGGPRGGGGAGFPSKPSKSLVALSLTKNEAAEKVANVVTNHYRLKIDNLPPVFQYPISLIPADVDYNEMSGDTFSVS